MTAKIFAYASWDYSILEFSERKLGALTKFVKEVDGTVLHAPKNQLLKGTMSNTIIVAS
ncbi:hypothetical protein [Pedobacter ginsengisoli]|uniref:hypothetical protein n=1 Tax=Pedobacter ginsengisoli TaxID=363852 RepID=UPI00254A98D5|nr:hypothetical protein [Pedobacter ginsengisoli]